MKKSCDSCIYVKVDKSLSHFHRLYCYFNPPQIVQNPDYGKYGKYGVDGSKTNTVRPRVLEDDFCSEFKPKTN